MIFNCRHRKMVAQGLIIMLHCVVFFGALNFVFSTDWSYKGNNGPSNWKNLPGNEACGGRRQSPINIDASKVQFNEALGKFIFTGYNTNPSRMTLLNNGHGVKVNLQGNIKVSGGGLDGDYKTEQFHFHWGSSNFKGSEHTINDKQYPMEVHFVHYSSRHSSLSEAVNQPNGLAMLGFMFEVSDNDNSALETLILGLANIPNKGDDTNLGAFPLNSFLPDHTDEFYRYEGSLTTPQCQETVIWTIFTNTIQISEKQLNAFRGLNKNALGSSQHAGKLVDNFRPVQAINGRKVFSRMKTNSAQTVRVKIPVELCIVSMLMAIFIF